MQPSSKEKSHVITKDNTDNQKQKKQCDREIYRSVTAKTPYNGTMKKESNNFFQLSVLAVDIIKE